MKTFRLKRSFPSTFHLNIVFQWLFLLGGIGLILLLSMNLSNLKINNDPRAYFDDAHAGYQELQQFGREFNSNELLFIFIQQRQGDLFNIDSLTVIEELTQKLWQGPAVQRVESITNYNYSYTQGDSIHSIPLFQLKDIDTFKRIALSDPQLQNHLITPKGDSTGIFVYLEPDSREHHKDTLQWIRETQEIYQNLYPDLSIKLAGSLVLSDQIHKSTVSEFKLFLPLCILIVVVMLYFFFRQAAFVFATFLVLSISVLISLFFASIFNIQITSLLAFVPVAIFTICLADAMHLLTSYTNHYSQCNHLSTDRKHRNVAIQKSVADNVKPMLVTTLTTVIGFLSLNTSASPPYRDLGNLVAIGSVSALCFTVVWVPLWITLFRVTPMPMSNWNRLANWIVRYPYRSMAVPIILLLISAIHLPKLYLDDSLSSLFDEDSPIHQVTTEIDQNLTGVHQIHFRVPTSSKVHNYEYVNSLSAFREWAQTQPEVSHVIGYDSIIAKTHQLMSDSLKETFPRNNDLISQYHLLYEMSLPYGAGMEEIVNFDQSATRMSVFLHQTSSQGILEFEKKANQWITHHWPQSMQTTALSVDGLFAQLNIDNNKNLFKGLMIAMICIGGYYHLANGLLLLRFIMYLCQRIACSDCLWSLGNDRWPNWIIRFYRGHHHAWDCSG